jgi:hypothetical protein
VGHQTGLPVAEPASIGWSVCVRGLRWSSGRVGCRGVYADPQATRPNAGRTRQSEDQWELAPRSDLSLRCRHDGCIIVALRRSAPVQTHHEGQVPDTRAESDK